MGKQDYMQAETADDFYVYVARGASNVTKIKDDKNIVHQYVNIPYKKVPGVKPLEGVTGDSFAVLISVSMKKTSPIDVFDSDGNRAVFDCKKVVCHDSNNTVPIFVFDGDNKRHTHFVEFSDVQPYVDEYNKVVEKDYSFNRMSFFRDGRVVGDKSVRDEADRILSIERDSEKAKKSKNDKFWGNVVLIKIAQYEKDSPDYMLESAMESIQSLKNNYNCNTSLLNLSNLSNAGSMTSDELQEFRSWCKDNNPVITDWDGSLRFDWAECIDKLWSPSGELSQEWKFKAYKYKQDYELVEKGEELEELKSMMHKRDLPKKHKEYVRQDAVEAIDSSNSAEKGLIKD